MQTHTQSHALPEQREIPKHGPNICCWRKRSEYLCHGTMVQLARFQPIPATFTVRSTKITLRQAALKGETSPAVTNRRRKTFEPRDSVLILLSIGIINR